MSVFTEESNGCFYIHCWTCGSKEHFSSGVFDEDDNDSYSELEYESKERKFYKKGQSLKNKSGKWGKEGSIVPNSKYVHCYICGSQIENHIGF